VAKIGSRHLKKIIRIIKREVHEMSDIPKIIVTDKNKVKAFFVFIWNAIKYVFKQLWAIPTDSKWDADAQKIAGLLIVIVGITIEITCCVKWDFSSKAPDIGIALITIGGALLGWRGHTDK
jgi:hypothetical protein